MLAPLLLLLCAAHASLASQYVASQYGQRNMRVLRPHMNAMDKRAAAVKYSSVVAIGASYQDNAHPRDAKYRSQQRPPPYKDGRFTNGPVAVEYLASTLKAALIDYAGGSVVDNDIPGEGKDLPDVGDQFGFYASALQKKSLKRGTARSLTVVWSCINPLTAIWNEWQQDGDVSKAHAHIDDNVDELTVQLMNISSNALLRKGVAGADFLLPTCPPLESIPNFFYQASPAGNKAQLAQLAQFRLRFEAGMKKSVAVLRKQKSFAKSRVVTFDTVAWWKAVMKSPKSYGFVNVKDPCYNTTTGKVCAKPTTYFYFDTLHPTTAAFKRLAAAFAKAINAA